MQILPSTNDVRRLIANGETNFAISTLLAIIESEDFHNEATLQSARFRELEKNLRLGIIDFKSAQITRNQINWALIQLIQEIDNLYSSKQESEYPRRKVLVHFVDLEFQSSAIKMLTKYQNHIQNLFEFVISDWEFFHLKDLKEKELRNYRSKSKLDSVNKIIELVQELPNRRNREYDIELVITAQLCLNRYYSWNTLDRSGIVISIGRILQVFGDFNQAYLMLIRVIQRMLIYSLGIPNLMAHTETRGCVFDM